MPAYSSSSSKEGGVYIIGLPTDDSQNNKMNNDQLGKGKKDSTAASYTKEYLESLIKGLFGAFDNIVILYKYGLYEKRHSFYALKLSPNTLFLIFAD